MKTQNYKRTTMETQFTTKNENKEPIPPNSEEIDNLDEYILTNDEGLLIDKSESSFIQEDGVLKWSIDGFYDENGNTPSPREMRRNPPVLKLESLNKDTNEIDVAAFVLTEHFMESFAYAMKGVNDGYRGIKPGEPRKIKDIPSDLIDWVKEHPFGFILTLIASAVLVWGIFQSF